MGVNSQFIRIALKTIIYPSLDRRKTISTREAILSTFMAIKYPMKGFYKSAFMIKS